MNRRMIALLLAAVLVLALTGCAKKEYLEGNPKTDLLATTQPVYQLTCALTDGTGLFVGLLISESVSCLHDYTLTVSQMEMIEQSGLVLESGLGLENFMEDVLRGKTRIDISRNLDTLPGEDGADPHWWLDPMRYKQAAELAAQEDALLQRCTALTPEDRVFLARRPDRPHIDEIIDNLFTDFFEQCGDRQCKEDAAILCGIARFHGMPVTVLGHRKGGSLEENLRCNFGMPGPEGYRKALRVMKQAEKFNRPIITFIDTPGAYPGKDAEERGQGEAIARCLMEMSGLSVPVLAVVTGEGSSGGALGLGVANHILMLENAVYSVLSPEGFASILWKDATRSGEACTMMRLTAQDLYDDGIVEEIIPEPLGGAQRGRQALFARMDTAIQAHLAKLCRMSGKALADQRYKKYRRIGEMRGA